MFARHDSSRCAGVLCLLIPDWAPKPFGSLVRQSLFLGLPRWALEPYAG